MKTTSQVSWNTITKWTGHTIYGIILIFLVPFLLNELGKEGYGLIALVGVIVTATGLADLGLRQGLGRHLAETVARQDKKRFNELVSTALLVYIAIGTFLSCVIIAAAPNIVKIFNVSQNLLPQAIFVVRWYGSVAVMASFLNPVYNAIFIAHNRFDILNNIFSTASIVQSIGLFIVLSLTHTGLYGWGWVLMATRGLALLTRIYAAYHLKPDLQIRLSHATADALKHLFCLGSKLFSVNIANLISIQADPIIIAQFLGIGDVALYRPGKILSGNTREFIDAFRFQIFPLTTGYSVNGEVKKIQEVLIRGTRYSSLMAIAICIVLIVFAEPIMKVWIGGTPIGEGYRTAGWVLFCWAIADLLNCSSGTQWAILLGINRLKFATIVLLILGLFNFITSIYLVGHTSLGIIGAVIPTVIMSAIERPILTVYTAKACELSTWRYLSEAYIRPLIVLVIVGIIAAVTRFFVEPTSLFSLIACFTATAAVWIPACWLIGFDGRDRELFLDVAVNFFTKISRRRPQSR